MSRLAELGRPLRRAIASALVAAPLLLPAAFVRADDGAWQELSPIVGRPYTVVVVDPSRDRLLVVGGMVANNVGSVDVWSLNLTGPPVWTKLVSDGSGPARRVGHNVIYDAAGDRLILFGGWNPQTDTRFNDVWSLSLAGLATWTALAPTGTPPAARYLASATYDPVRQRMLVFAGYVGGPSNDLWELSLGGTPTWTHLAPGGTTAYPRYGHSAVYDPVGDQLVIYGGHSGNQPASDTWTLSLGGTLQWTQIALGTTPPPREHQSAIYDPAGNRMIVFAGYQFPAGLNDVWALTLGGTPAWAQISASGAAPGVRFAHSAAFDAAHDRMLAFGGQGGSDYFGDVATLSLSGSPAWSSLWPENAYQPIRENHTAIYDPVRRRMVSFGGRDRFSAPTNEVWEFPLDDPHAWAKLAPTGTSPAVRSAHSAIYDPVRDRMLVFGGVTSGDLVNDLWSLSLGGATAWSSVTAAGTAPAGRRWHSAIYDPVRDRMLVFGGANTSQNFNDVWELSLSGTVTWTQLATAGAPPASRNGHTAIYDPVSDRMIVFGGSAGVVKNDTWALTLSGTPTWSLITPLGGLPPPRRNHTAIYDAARGRMVVYGGYNSVPTQVADAWAIDVNAPSPLWQPLSLGGPGPLGRAYHVAIADPVGDRMIIHGGGYADTWSLQWPVLTGVPTPTVPVALRLGASVPNPARGTLSIPFELPAAATARVTVLDLQGRVIRTLVRASLPAGSHVARWDGRTASGARARSGVYLYRLDALGAHRSGRLVITE